MVLVMHTLAGDDMRVLMRLLLKQPAFDAFGLRQLTIRSYARFDIEGGEPDDSGAVSYRPWGEFKPYAAHVIKTGGKPRFMKTVLSCPEGLLSDYPEAQALFINVIFDKDVAHVTTGCAMRSFSLDKSCEGRWDAYAEGFLRNNGIILQTKEE